MQCCEGGFFGGSDMEILCDKEENHDGQHHAWLFIYRECDGERLAIDAFWDKKPCKQHPTGAHVSEEYKAAVKGEEPPAPEKDRCTSCGAEFDGLFVMLCDACLEKLNNVKK